MDLSANSQPWKPVSKICNLYHWYVCLLWSGCYSFIYYSLIIYFNTPKDSHLPCYNSFSEFFLPIDTSFYEHFVIIDLNYRMIYWYIALKLTINLFLDQTFVDSHVSQFYFEKNYHLIMNLTFSKKK